jgi:hypothetical protein
MKTAAVCSRSLALALVVGLLWRGSRGTSHDGAHPVVRGGDEALLPRVSSQATVLKKAIKARLGYLQLARTASGPRRSMISDAPEALQPKAPGLTVDLRIARRRMRGDVNRHCPRVRRLCRATAKQEGRLVGYAVWALRHNGEWRGGVIGLP